MAKSQPLQATKQQLNLIEKIRNLPGVAETGKTPLNVTLFDYSFNVAVEILLDVNHNTHAKAGLYICLEDESEPISLWTFYKNLEERHRLAHQRKSKKKESNEDQNEKEEEWQNTALELWGARLLSLDNKYYPGTMSPEFIDKTKMTTVEYVNDMLKRMHDDGISRENAANMWIHKCLKSSRDRKTEVEEGIYHSDAGMGPARWVTEQMVLSAMSDIENKVDWQTKIWDDTIVAKWKSELTDKSFLPGMLDWLVAALQYKSKQKDRQTGIEMAAPPGVYFSESIISDDLRDNLLKDIERLSDVEDDLKDWHPGSNQQVLNLLHPSMNCLVDQRSYLTHPFETTEATKTIDLVQAFFNWYEGDKTESIIFDAKELTLLGSKKVPARPATNYRDILNRTGININLDMIHCYQWLPSDIRLDANGKATILSYINGLDLNTNADLYSHLEQLVTSVIPLWSTCLTTHTNPNLARELHGPGTISNFYTKVKDDRVKDVYFDPPTLQDFQRIRQERLDKGEDDIRETFKNERADRKRDAEGMKDTEKRDESAWKRFRKFIPIDADLFTLPKVLDEKDKFQMHNRTIQVIFKIASIELTPDKPSYEGGTWHVEGTDREQIVSTVIYYLDSDNITTPTLSFRQRIDATKMKMGGYRTMFYDDYNEIMNEDKDHCLTRLYGKWDDPSEDAQSGSVDLGYIKTPGKRVIAFPNSMQHKLSPFKLIDESKPGIRKIIVMFLVDPTHRIPSTAEVSPQSLNDKQVANALGVEITQLGQMQLKGMPVEISEMILDSYLKPSKRAFEEIKRIVSTREAKEEERMRKRLYLSMFEEEEDHVTFQAPIAFEEACWHRDRLMAQRRRRNVEIAIKTDEIGEWNLCEH